MAELENLARDAVAWMKSRSGDVAAEVYLSRGEERMLSRREGEREGVEAAESSGAGVRVARGGRVGFAAAGGADLSSIQELYTLALEQLPHAEPEAGRALPGPASSSGSDAALAATLWDETLFTAPWEAVESRLAEAEAAARAEKRVTKIVRSEYGESRGHVIIANTSGLFASERGGSAYVSLVVAAENGAEVLIGEGYRAERRSAALDFAAAGREAGRRAASMLGAKRAKAGKRAVLFEPWVAGEFLELLAELLSADEVQGGRSLLAGKLGKAVASPLLTLRDDPRRPGGLGTSLFDDEGVATRDKAMIEGGVLRAYFHDAFTAAREGASSNGCGYRGSYDSLPGPGASNFYLAPGPVTREALISDTKSGLLVAEVLGMHMVDPVSGSFSVGVSGLAIEKGALAGPVKGAMLSGNLLDLLSRVDGVASDLTFQGSLGSPTFRVSSLDVA